MWAALRHWGARCRNHPRNRCEQLASAPVPSPWRGSLAVMSATLGPLIPAQAWWSPLGILTPWSQDVFIRKSSPLGAYNLCCHYGGKNYSNTPAFPVLPGTHLLLDLENARVGKVSCLGSQSHNISSGRRFEPAISRLQMAQATAAPRRPTHLYTILIWI